MIHDMMHFTSKLALGKADESVHSRLVKYSKGDFEGPAIEVTVKGKTITVNGGPEYEDLIGSILVNHAPDQLEFRVTGAIRCSDDQSEVLGNAGLDIKTSKKKGKSSYEAKFTDNQIAAKTLRDIYSKLVTNCFLFLTVKPASGGRDWSMTTKKSYPRPSPKGETKGAGTDFCKAILPASDKLAEDVLLEVAPDFRGEIQGSFKQLRVGNLYKISEVVLPEGKERLGFTEIRLKAKKKGALVRKVTVDGRELTKETQFCI